VPTVGDPHLHDLPAPLHLPLHCRPHLQNRIRGTTHCMDNEIHLHHTISPHAHDTTRTTAHVAQVNLVVLFEDGHLVTENFPIRLIRT